MEQTGHPDFPFAPGEVAALIRSHDWSATALGPPERWNCALRSAVTLMLNSPEPSYLAWGPELSFFYNDAFLPILQDRPAALGARMPELWPDAWPHVQAVAEQALAGTPSRCQNLAVTMHRHGSQEQTWWSFSYAPLADDEGRIAGLFCIVNETTEQIKSAAALNASHARHRQILDSALDYAIVAMDMAGRVTSWNEGATHILGWSEAEMMGELVHRFFTDEDVQSGEVARAMQAAVDRGRARTERWHVRSCGERFWGSCDTSCIRAAEGHVTGFVKVLRDRTEQRSVEEASRRDRARLAAAVDIARLGTFEWDTVTGLVELSARSRGLFGLPAHGVITQDDIFGRMADTDIERVYAASIAAASASSGMEIDYEIVLPDGTRRAIDSVGNFLGGEVGGRRMFGVFSDVTERKLAEAELRHLNETLERRVEEATAECEAAHEALRQSQKMEAVGQLSGGLAHDFNNLLTGIMGSLELMRTRFGQGRTEGIERYIDAAQGAARRAASVTHRLLAFSRRQTLAPKLVDVPRLVNGLRYHMMRTAGPAIKLELVAPGEADETCSTLVDAGQLEDALLHLCANARDAMPGGGSITVKASRLPLGDEKARQHDLPAGDYVCISVGDTGSGMSAETVARAFDPFFTTKPMGLGTGLGLSMIYGFVRQSGGHIRIISEAGHGTLVCLYLPLHGGTDAPAALKDVIQALPGQNPVVLIVDDEPTVRMLVSELVEDQGYGWMQAQDGEAAMRILNSAARIDLLLTDVGLPGGMNGRQVADAARALRPGLRVLFITGYAETALLDEGQLEAGMDVLSKPFAMDVLADRIATLLGS